MTASEVQSVEKVLLSPIEGIREHFITALQFLSDRKSPNYRNSGRKQSDLRTKGNKKEELSIMRTARSLYHRVSRIAGTSAKRGLAPTSKAFLAVSRPFGATSRDFQEFPLSVVPLLDCGFPIFIAHQDSASVRFILFAFAPITQRIITFCLCCETTQRFTYCKGEYFYVTFWHDKHIIPLAHFNLANHGALTIAAR